MNHINVFLKISKKIIADWVSKEDYPNGPPKLDGPWRETPRGYTNEEIVENKKEEKSIQFGKKQINLYKKSKSEDREERAQVAEDKETHPATLDQLSEDNDYNVVSEVALNENTRSLTLHKLKNHKNPLVRECVSINPNTSAKTLNEMINDSDDLVVTNVARHPNTHPLTLSDLSLNENDFVRHEVATNPNTPLDILKKNV